MAYLPTLLEDSLDLWLAVEAQVERRAAVIRFLMDLCDTEGAWEEAKRVDGTQLPAFAALVPGTGVIIVWVIAEKHGQIAVRYLYDLATGQRYGG